jgi:hypothetical protein
MTAGFSVARKSRRRFALDTFAVWAAFGKAAAEPPHSKMGWAELALLALRDAFFLWATRSAQPILIVLTRLAFSFS